MVVFVHLSGHLCRTAEDMKGADTYLYDLNHFTLVEEAEEAEGQRPDRWVVE